MKKLYGILLVALGILGISFDFALAIVCMYVDKASNTSYFTQLFPYIEEMLFPIFLSFIPVVIGIFVLASDKRA